MIEHDNIFYCRDISELGGVETYFYELVKKFKDYDIAVVYKTAHPNQIKRLKKLCRVYQHTEEKIKCKVAIINYDVSIIDYIEEGADIYQGIHADYENPAYKWQPPTHPRIKTYIAITKHIEQSFKKMTGLNNVMQMYNPLTIEPSKKLVLISATRLSKIKGKDRMIKLAQELDRQGIDYIWYVFTNDTDAIPSDNVIYMKPRLDISYWLDQADYLVQLSDTEGLSYSINEMLYRNKPVIVTPLPYLDEIGVKDNINAYIMEFDCSNVEDIVKKINNIPKFTFEKLKENYDDIIIKTPSNYQEYLNTKARCKCIIEPGYYDIELQRQIQYNEELPLILEDRAKHLEKLRYIEIQEIIKGDNNGTRKHTTSKKKSNRKNSNNGCTTSR